MQKLSRRFRHALDRAQNRFRQSRPGSVLILVVVLLVLMALLATAYLNTARTDRYSSQQNAYNTEIDLLLQGVINIVEGKVAQDWGNIDSPTNTPFLADRLPMPVRGQPGWSHISQWLAGQNFESPLLPTSGNPLCHQRAGMIATSVPINTPAGPTNYPALMDTIGNQTVTPQEPAGTVYLAGNASGDGIADGLLFRLPVGEINGVTYYSTVRTLDNGSANNASVNFAPNATPNNFAPLPGNYFPTNIDLLDVLPNGAAELGMPTNLGAGAPGLVPQYLLNKAGYSPTPFSDLGGARADFVWNSPYDGLWSQLGRRLDNPGYLSATVQYQALPISESMAMAYRFCLENPNASPSVIEQYLKQATTSPLNTYVKTSPFAPGNTAKWYTQFAFENEIGAGAPPSLPRRAVLVAGNPVNNLIPTTGNGITGGNKYTSRGTWVAGTGYNFGDWVQYTFNGPTRSFICIQPTNGIAPSTSTSNLANTNYLYWAAVPWVNAPVKASINTATFEELWAAFWSTMYDPTNTGAIAGTKGVPAYASGGAFRNPIRDSTNAKSLTPNQVLQLRSALAALNAKALRSSSDNVLSRQINLVDSNNKAVTAMLYSNGPQPYITEVYARNDVPTGYMAVELYNPFPDRSISIANYKLAAINRAAGNTNLVPTPIDSTPLATAVIPPNGYIVLASSATFPTGTTPPAALAANQLIIVPALLTAFNNELVILRPRGGPPSSTDPANVYNETTLADLVPTDSYDFTNLALPETDKITYPNGRVWHYTRANDASHNWQFVYPGPYNFTTNATGPRLVGTMQSAGGAAATDIDLSKMGSADTTQTNPGPGPNAYTSVPLQISNIDTAGPLRLGQQNPNRFPFGQFARNGDILQTPYIGAYRIKTNDLINELNAVTMDSAFADDADPSDDKVENIGRFTPILPQDLTDTTSTSTVNDYGTNLNVWRYHWAMGLFDYFNVLAPQDDYFPNVDPNPLAPGGISQYANATGNSPNSPVVPVANSSKNVKNASALNPNGATEELAGINGLIDVNTAPWPVLATVPFVDASMGISAQQALNFNVKVAQAIVNYRDIDDGDHTVSNPHPHGAFKGLFELNNVPLFRTAAGALPAQPINTAKSNTFGDISPLAYAPHPTLATDGVVRDFESQNMMLTRISNLVSTRTDSFTAYVLVQGWRNIGTNTPELVVQRRAAIIMDRSGYNPTTKQLSVTNVPSN